MSFSLRMLTQSACGATFQGLHEPLFEIGEWLIHPWCMAPCVLVCQIGMRTDG